MRLKLRVPSRSTEALTFDDFGANAVNHRWYRRMFFTFDGVDYDGCFAGSVVAATDSNTLDSRLENVNAMVVFCNQAPIKFRCVHARGSRAFVIRQPGAYALNLARHPGPGHIGQVDHECRLPRGIRTATYFHRPNSRVRGQKIHCVTISNSSCELLLLRSDRH